MKVIGYISLFLLGAVGCYLLLSFGVVDAIDGLPGAMQEPALSLPTYLSFISVLLTAVTVVLAALAIGIGIVAAYTFREIREEARIAAYKVADETAQKRADELLSEEAIRARIDQVAFGNIQGGQPEQLAELEEDFDANDGGER